MSTEEMKETLGNKWDEEYKVREGRRCMGCGSMEELTEHHILTEEGFRTQIKVVLCKPCHRKRHRKMFKKRSGLR